MIDCDERTQIQPGSYEAPTLDELVSTGRALGLVGGMERTLTGVRLEIVGQVFVVPAAAAEAMLHGVLLGYFAATSREDLAAAQWR